MSTARKDFDLVAKNESLLNNVKERTLDKKFKIRKEALTGLALIYKKHLSDPLSVPEATKMAVTWIKDKILHGKINLELNIEYTVGIRFKFDSTQLYFMAYYLESLPQPFSNWKCNWKWRDLNPRPSEYQSIALPTEQSWLD